MYLVYLLKCDNLTYIGMTNNFFRRWRQHIGDLKGGAKYTTRKGKEWYPILIIDGFETMKEAMQCEWKLKHNKKKRGYHKKIQWAYELLSSHTYWTSNSPSIISQKLNVYIDNNFKDIFKNYPTRELYWK